MTSILPVSKLVILLMSCLAWSMNAQASKTLKENLACGNNDQALQLAALITKNREQQRLTLNCNTKLNEIALIKAQLILENQTIWHNAGNLTPNQLLRHHGFKLPKTYAVFGNQVEAIAGGEQQVESVFKGFLASKPHRSLLLGEDSFFKAQDQIGVAYLKDVDSAHEHYWVIIIADERNVNIEQNPVVKVDPPVVIKKRHRGKEIKQRMYRNKVRGKLR